jgi:hypothetical protein
MSPGHSQLVSIMKHDNLTGDFIFESLIIFYNFDQYCGMPSQVKTMILARWQHQAVIDYV